MLAGFLDRDPSTRLGGEEVKEHPFFEDIDWDELDARKSRFHLSSLNSLVSGTTVEASGSR